MIELVREGQMIGGQIEDVGHPDADRAPIKREQHRACSEQECSEGKSDATHQVAISLPEMAYPINISHRIC